MSHCKNELCSGGKQNISKRPLGSLPASSIPSLSSSLKGCTLEKTKQPVAVNCRSNIPCGTRNSNDGNISVPSIVSTCSGIPKPTSVRNMTKSEIEPPCDVEVNSNNYDMKDKSHLMKPADASSVIMNNPNKNKIRTFGSEHTGDIKFHKVTADNKVKKSKNVVDSIQQASDNLNTELAKSHVSLLEKQAKLYTSITSAAHSINPLGVSVVTLPAMLQPNSPVKNQRSRSISPRKSAKNVDSIIASKLTDSNDSATRGGIDLLRSRCSSSTSISAVTPSVSPLRKSSFGHSSHQFQSYNHPPSSTTGQVMAMDKKQTRKTGIASVTTQKSKNMSIPVASSPASATQLIGSKSSVSLSQDTLPHSSHLSRSKRKKFGSADKMLLLNSSSKTANAMKTVMLSATASKSEIKPPKLSSKMAKDLSFDETYERKADLNRLHAFGCQKTSPDAHVINSKNSSDSKLLFRSPPAKCSSYSSLIAANEAMKCEKNEHGSSYVSRHSRISRMPCYSQLPKDNQRLASGGSRPISASSYERCRNVSQRRFSVEGSSGDASNNENQILSSEGLIFYSRVSGKQNNDLNSDHALNNVKELDLQEPKSRNRNRKKHSILFNSAVNEISIDAVQDCMANTEREICKTLADNMSKSIIDDGIVDNVDSCLQSSNDVFQVLNRVKPLLLNPSNTMDCSGHCNELVPPLGYGEIGREEQSMNKELLDSENMSALDVKPMQPFTRGIGMTGSISHICPPCKLPQLSSHGINSSCVGPFQGQGYLTMSSENLNGIQLDTEAEYMSGVDFISCSSQMDHTSNRYMSDGEVIFSSPHHSHSVGDISGTWKKSEKNMNLMRNDSYDEIVSENSKDSKDGSLILNDQDDLSLKNLSVATLQPQQGKKKSENKTSLSSTYNETEILKQGVFARSRLPTHGRKAVLPIAGFVKKSQGVVSTDSDKDIPSSFTLLDLEQMVGQEKAATDFENPESECPVDHSELRNINLPSLVGPSPVADSCKSSDLCRKNTRLSFPAAFTSTSLCSDEVSDQSKDLISSNLKELRYGSLGRHCLTFGVRKVPFDTNLGNSGEFPQIQDNRQSFSDGNPSATTSQLDASGVSSNRTGNNCHKHIDPLKSTILSRQPVFNPGSSSILAKPDAADISEMTNSISRCLRSHLSMDSSLDNTLSMSLFEESQDLPTTMNDSLHKNQSSHLSKCHNSLSHHSRLGLSVDNILHGSSLSLSSNSTLHLNAEELQAQEIRKLRQELELAQAKVSTLNLQVSTNEEVISAFEQSLKSTTNRFQELASLTDRKEAEVHDLQNTIELLQKQIHISAMASHDQMNSNLMAGDYEYRHAFSDACSYSGSIDQLSDFSDSDKKKKQKNWFASFGKALKPRRKSKTLTLFDQDLGMMECSQHIQSYSQDNSTLLPPCDSNTSKSLGNSTIDLQFSNSKDESLKLAPVLELEKQLHEKDMELTDVRLEALTSAHKLDQMKNNLTRMKNEILFLKSENERIQYLVSKQNTIATSLPKQFDISHEMAVEYPICQGVRLGDAESRDTPSIIISVCSYQSNADCSTGQEVSSIPIWRLAVNEIISWEDLRLLLYSKFKDHCFMLDPESGLGLNEESVKSFSIGEVTFSKGCETPKHSPHRYLVGENINITMTIKGVNDNSTDCLAFDTLIPKPIIQRYIALLNDHQRIILCGPSGTGKTHLAQKLAEYLVEWSGKKLTRNSIALFNVDHKSSKELRQYLSNIADQCEWNSTEVPNVIILDNLHYVASLGEVFNGFLSMKNQQRPYMIGTMNQATCLTTDLQLHHNFRWVLYANHIEPVHGFLSRYLRRCLIKERVLSGEVCCDMDSVIEWLPKVWQHLNRFLEAHSSSDVTIGPRLFLSCPMKISVVKTWFMELWNYSILPYMMEAVREGIQAYGCRASWEDPEEMIVKTCPWNQSAKDCILLQKLRQEDVGYDRQPTPTENVKTYLSMQEDNKATTDPLLDMLLRLQDAVNRDGLHSTNGKDTVA